MFERSLSTLALAMALSPALVPGQTPAPLAPARLQAPAASWRIPLHTNQADPVGGSYGLWAVGPDYKVSFDGGFHFYPVLGEAYPENLPLSWRTERIALGGHVLADGATTAEVSHADWWYELHHRGVVERYDILEQGVEQSFVIDRDPGVAGDLVIEGLVTSRLSAESQAARHGGLVFRDDDGNPIVSYGAAIAFDAIGRLTEVTTAYDGERITLRLGGEWIAEAEFPITVDPLTSRLQIPRISSPSNGVPSYPSIARDDVNGGLLVAYSRASSASDWDLLARLYSDNFLSEIALIVSDATAMWSTRYSSLAWIRGAGSWALGLGRDFSTFSGVRVYVHDTAVRTTNAGFTMYVQPPAGFSDQHPSVGALGSFLLDGSLYLAFRRDPGAAAAPNSPDSRVHGVLLNVLSQTFGPVENLHTLQSVTDYDAEWPQVTQDAGTGSSWVVVWQELNHANANDDWDVLGVRVSRTGALTSNAVFGPGNTTSRHKLYPQVAGSSGRYLVSYLLRDNTSSVASTTGDTLEVQRFDWLDTASSPTKYAPQTAASAAGNGLRANLANRAIAYDDNTDSHWALAYRDTANDVHAVRLGSNGAVVERAVVFTDPTIAGISPALCHNSQDYEFPIVYGTNDGPQNLLWGVRFQYGSARLVRFGSGCQGAIHAYNRGPRDNPYAGSQYFSIDLEGGRPLSPTTLFAGVSGPALPLPGNPGCSLLIDPGIVLIPVASGVADLAGDFGVDLPIPSNPVPVDISWQFLQFDSGLLYSTGGLRTEVR